MSRSGRVENTGSIGDLEAPAIALLVAGFILMVLKGLFL
jgi:hypothetical protein